MIKQKLIMNKFDNSDHNWPNLAKNNQNNWKCLLSSSRVNFNSSLRFLLEKHKSFLTHRFKGNWSLFHDIPYEWAIIPNFIGWNCKWKMIILPSGGAPSPAPLHVRDENDLKYTKGTFSSTYSLTELERVKMVAKLRTVFWLSRSRYFTNV